VFLYYHEGWLKKYPILGRMDRLARLPARRRRLRHIFVFHQEMTVTEFDDSWHLAVLRFTAMTGTNYSLNSVGIP
jgi:hypothetical protein